LSISFRPAAIVTLSGSLVLTDNNLNAAAPGYTTQSISLSGTGVQATPAITWATPAAIPYGTALSSTQLNATSTVAGTFVYSPAAGAILNAGSQTLSVTFTPMDTADYATVTATTSITLSATVPALAFAPIATQVAGAAPFAVGATSASSGAVTYVVVSGPATIVGDLVTLTGVGTVVLSADQAASGNYAPATANTSFTAGLPFTLSSTGAGTGTTSATVAPGAVASFTFTLAPGSETKLPDAVTFTATGLPTGATATFSPATIAAGSAATSVTLSIQISNTQTARNEQSFSGGLVSLGYLLLPLLGMKSARKRLPQMSRLSLVLLAMGLSVGTVLGMTGCSGGSVTATTPTAQNYIVVVTAKDATIGVQSSTNFILTVK
jgi:hypothetical protein